MKVNGKIIECLQGERFPQLMSGFDYINADQIVILLYRSNDTSFAKSFVKVADDKYPEAGLVTVNEAEKMVFTVSTEGMEPGKYDIEIRVDLVGVSAPIVKDRTDYLIVKQSRT